MATNSWSKIKKIVSSPACIIAASIGFPVAAMLILVTTGAYYNPADPSGPYHIFRNISYAATALSAIPSTITGLRIAVAENAGKSVINVFKGLGIALGVPLVVHLIGTFIINNFGDLGIGGL